MVERYLKIQAARQELLRELMAFDTWSQWWPGVLSARVLLSEPSRTVVELVVKSLMTISMTLEFLHSNDSVITFKQVTGWFKSYRGAYTLLTPPGNTGLTLKVSISADPGLLVPRGIIRATLGSNLVQLEEALNKRLKERAALAPPTIAQAQAPTLEVGSAAIPARKIAHVFPTKWGWEVWIAGRRYAARSKIPMAPRGTPGGIPFVHG